MLVELRIQDFAIIDQLEIHFNPGLITFTGETGAGKSIIIDAVETLLGGRAEAVQVRSGKDRATVEGVFFISENLRSEIQEILEREDLQEGSEYLTLAREIRTNGRNVARVNGHSVNAGLLRELGEYLIDIHGQSEHLSLHRVARHLGLLDSYLIADQGNQAQDLIKTYRKIYQQHQSIQREIDELCQAERDAARRTDMLNFQINEIQSARLRPEEEKELREERNRLANAGGLASLTQECLVALDEGMPDTPAATDLFGQVSHALAGLVRLDPSQNGLEEQAQNIFDNMSDLAHNLRNYLENIEFNPKRLDQVEERLGLIQNLKRKYGESIPAILEFAASAQRQLDAITHASERIEELDAEKSRLLDQLREQGQILSQKRQEAAVKLETAMESELNDLKMSGARFKVEFQQQYYENGVTLDDDRRVVYLPNGLEKIEFLIAPNPGEGFKPLARIASGGETSRLMLALKNVLAKADQIPTLIFDEIDQGIGGRVGAIVGQKLWSLGRQHQVLCITHLPQLAAFGDQHLHVQKQVESGRTLTQIKSLEGESRIYELAQMLGEVSEGTLHSARELTQQVKNFGGVG